MTFLSLFAGIGGFDLGLTRSGMRCVGQVEIDLWCRKVLAKHWPEVPRHDDIRTFPPTDPEQWKADVICGGFPCQDISVAGKGAGINGERSGLWSEYARIIGLLRPKFVIVENVRALVGRGLSRVLMDLAKLRYDAEWQIISAAAFGAPHIRERLFIVAYTGRELWDTRRNDKEGKASIWGESPSIDQRLRQDVADTSGERWRQGNQDDRGSEKGTGEREESRSGFCGEAMANSNSERREEFDVAAESGRPRFDCWRTRSPTNYWEVEPAICRVVDGLRNRVDRLRGLGNAVVPQIIEWIGRRIIEVDHEEVKA